MEAVAECAADVGAGLGAAGVDAGGVAGLMGGRYEGVDCDQTSGVRGHIADRKIIPEIPRTLISASSLLSARLSSSARDSNSPKP